MQPRQHLAEPEDPEEVPRHQAYRRVTRHVLRAPLDAAFDYGHGETPRPASAFVARTMQRSESIPRTDSYTHAYDCIQFGHCDLLGTLERGCHLILLLQKTSAIVTPASIIDGCLPLEIGMELFDGIWPSTVSPVRIVDAFLR